MSQQAGDQESQCFSSSRKAGKKMLSNLKPTRRRKSCLLWGRSAFCSIWVFSWLDQTHPHWGEPSAFLSRLIQMLMSSATFSQTHPESCVVQCLSTLWCSQVHTENWPSHLFTHRVTGSEASNSPRSWGHHAGSKDLQPTCLLATAVGPVSYGDLRNVSTAHLVKPSVGSLRLS